MQSCPAFSAPFQRIQPRTALLASADGSFRQKLSDILTGLRWQVREAGGAADAWHQAQSALPEAVIVDSWLPDLDCGEFLREFQTSFPEVALLRSDGSFANGRGRATHKQELLFALQRSQTSDCDARNLAPATSGILVKAPGLDGVPRPATDDGPQSNRHMENTREDQVPHLSGAISRPRLDPTCSEKVRLAVCERLPEFVGEAPCMLEVSRRIRLVAPRSTSVLIEGPTGSGKELVAEALHRLSTRSRKPFVAINCAAIPETLLEAELFGHTRGAFTGAVQGRVGRIEAADGGTLFLDEIGEMPLALQAKLLRFVESGELQRIGDNETVKVDVRVVAATHRPLAQHTVTGAFRADLYYRLAVFLIRTPALVDHLEDLPDLVRHFLAHMGRQSPIKNIAPAALEKMRAHSWPGNVRELEHVLERAAILAGDASEISEDEIDFGVAIA